MHTKYLGLSPTLFSADVYGSWLRTIGSRSVAIVGIDSKDNRMAGATVITHVQRMHVVASFESPAEFYAIRRFVSVTASGDCYFVAPLGFDSHPHASSFVRMLQQSFAYSSRGSLRNATPMFLAPTAEECVFVLENNSDRVRRVWNENEDGGHGFDDVLLLRCGTLIATHRNRIYACHYSEGVGYLPWTFVGGVFHKSCTRIVFGLEEPNRVYATCFGKAGEAMMVEFDVTTAAISEGHIAVAREVRQPHAGVMWQPAGSVGIVGASPHFFAFVRRTPTSAEFVTVPRLPHMKLGELVALIPAPHFCHRSKGTAPVCAASD